MEEQHMDELKDLCGAILNQREGLLLRAVRMRGIRRGSSREKLISCAREAMERAEQSLDQRKYRLFALYLQHYSDIWQFAAANLDPEDYRLFCLAQSGPDSEQVM